MLSSTRKATLNEDIRAWSTAIVVCLALMLGFASTGYGDTILGNWENRMDGWSMVDATAADPCEGFGNTLDDYSLKVAVPSGWHMAVMRDSGLLPDVTTAATIKVDITLKASEWEIGAGWVKAIENVVFQSTNVGWVQLNPVGGDPAIGWDGLEDKTITATFDANSVNWGTGNTWAKIIIVTNYDGVTKAGNFYFDNLRIVTAAMAISKCTVTAGKTQASTDTDYSNMADTFTASGTVLLPAGVNDINAVGVTISSTTDGEVIYTETLSDFNATVVNSKHKYTHTGKIIKGQEGKITSMTLDFRKGTFAIAAKNIDLTGLACPLELKFTMGSTELNGDAAEMVVNGTKTIPTRLMRLYKDTLIVPAGKAKVKSSTKASSGSLSVTGEIAVEDININLCNSPVVITWSDANDTNHVQTFTIPEHSFNSKTGHSYTLGKNITPTVTPVAQPNAKVSGTIDLDKCTFALSITKADINTVPGEANFGIKFGDFNEVANYTLP